MIDHNPYAITTQPPSTSLAPSTSSGGEGAVASTFDFAEVWGAAYGSADEQLRVLWVRLRDAWLRSKKGSEHTRRSYERASNDWMAFVSGIRVSGRPLQLWEVTPGHVRLWQEELSQSLSASTVNQRLSACSSWYSFVIAERGMVDGFEVSAFMDRSGKTRANPFAAATVTRDKSERYARARVLTMAEIHALLDSLDKRVERSKEPGRVARDRALILTYLMTGYRNAEALRLRVGDIQPHKTVPGAFVVRWQGKGGKARTEAFPTRLVAAINSYFELAGRQAAGDEFIFLPWKTEQLSNLGVEAAEGQPICGMTARRIVKSALRKAGIEDWAAVRVHDLRHTFAHRFRANNSDLKALQDRLKHSSLATTEIYVTTALDEPLDDWSEGLF